MRREPLPGSASGDPPEALSLPTEFAPAEREETDLSQGAFSEDGVDLTLIAWSLSLTPEQRLTAAQDFLDGLMELRDGRSNDARTTGAQPEVRTPLQPYSFFGPGIGPNWKPRLTRA